MKCLGKCYAQSSCHSPRCPWRPRALGRVQARRVVPGYQRSDRGYNSIAGWRTMSVSRTPEAAIGPWSARWMTTLLIAWGDCIQTTASLAELARRRDAKVDRRLRIAVSPAVRLLGRLIREQRRKHQTRNEICTQSDASHTSCIFRFGNQCSGPFRHQVSPDSERWLGDTC